MSQAGSLTGGGGPTPPTIATQYTTDAGIAIPAGNNLNVFGSGAASTTGVGDTITVVVPLGAGLTLTPDEDFDGSAATPISPQAGNINIFGYGIGTSLTHVTETNNSTGTAAGNLQVEDRTWQTQYVVDASSTVGTRGTYTTIASAITAAGLDGASSSAFKNIYIRPGLYVENLTPIDGVNLIGLDGMGQDNGVIIQGTHSANFTGLFSFNNIALLQISTSSIINFTTSTAVCTINVNNCTFTGSTAGSGVGANNVNASINIIGGTSTMTGTGYMFGSSTIGNFYCQNHTLLNTGSSTTQSLFTAAVSITLVDCNWQAGISYSASVKSLIYNTTIDFSAQALGIPLSIAGAGTHIVSGCLFAAGGTNAAINNTVNATISNCTLTTSNTTNIIAGSGTTTYSDISVFGSASGPLTASAGTSVLGKQAVGAEFVELPAGNLTVKANHRFVGVDTTATRTITLPATKVIGQRHTIADITGSAGTNNITVSGNGSNILGSTSAASYIINVNGASIDVLWTGVIWKVC